MHLKVFARPAPWIPSVVAAVRQGGSPLVVLLHGWGRTHSDWDHVIDLLPEEFSILAPDLPGFGESPPPERTIGAYGYGAALPALIEGVGHSDRIVLVGHSFGGRVALCAPEPLSPEGLVLAAVPIIAPQPPRPPLTYRLVRRLAPLLGEHALARARRHFGSEDYRRAEGVMREVLVTVVHESYHEELARLDVPVAMVWGDRDTACPLPLAREAAALNPRARLEVLEGVGHMLPLVAPEAVAQAVMAIVDGSKLGR